MGQVCACDKQDAEGSATPMAVQRKIQQQTERAMARDDSRTKLMVPAESARATPEKETKNTTLGQQEEEEQHLNLENTSNRSLIATPKGVVAFSSTNYPTSPTKSSSSTRTRRQELEEATRKQELEQAKKRKEKKLEESLRSQHCRPLLKLFKLMTTESFRAEFEEESPELASYIESTLQQLQSRNLDASCDLSSLLKFGSTDDESSENQAKALLSGLTCRDLEQLLNRECFKPQIFASYIKLLNQLNEVKLDCSETVQSVYQEGEIVPGWAAESASLNHQASANIVENQSSWNKVIVLDPPTLISVQEKYSDVADPEALMAPKTESQLYDPNSANHLAEGQEEASAEIMPELMKHISTTSEVTPALNNIIPNDDGSQGSPRLAMHGRSDSQQPVDTRLQSISPEDSRPQKEVATPPNVPNQDHTPQSDPFDGAFDNDYNNKSKGDQLVREPSEKSLSKRSTQFVDKVADHGDDDGIESSNDSLGGEQEVVINTAGEDGPPIADVATTAQTELKQTLDESSDEGVPSERMDTEENGIQSTSMIKTGQDLTGNKNEGEGSQENGELLQSEQQLEGGEAEDDQGNPPEGDAVDEADGAAIPEELTVNQADNENSEQALEERVEEDINLTGNYVRKFGIPELNEMQKKALLSSRGILVPVLVDEQNNLTIADGKDEANSRKPEGRKQVFLVHLKIGQMTVTVYTSQDSEEEEEHVDEAASAGHDSAELDEVGDEFSIPEAILAQDDSQDLSSAAIERRMTTAKVQQIGHVIQSTEQTGETEVAAEVEEKVVEASPQKSIVHLISDFVIELLESLEIPDAQIEELAANMELVKTLDRPEDMLIHLTTIAGKIIKNESLETDQILEPTLPQIRLEAAKMTLSYLGLLA